MRDYYSPPPAEIKNTRLRANLNQQVCSGKVCVTTTTWSRWETGQHVMPAGLWKLFLIELNYVEDVNEVNEVIPLSPLEALTKDWSEDATIT